MLKNTLTYSYLVDYLNLIFFSILVSYSRHLVYFIFMFIPIFSPSFLFLRTNWFNFEWNFQPNLLFQLNLLLQRISPSTTETCPRKDISFQDSWVKCREKQVHAFSKGISIKARIFSQVTFLMLISITASNNNGFN